MIRIALKDIYLRFEASSTTQFIDQLDTLTDVTGWKARPGSYVAFTVCAQCGQHLPEQRTQDILSSLQVLHPPGRYWDAITQVDGLLRLKACSRRAFCKPRAARTRDTLYACCQFVLITFPWCQSRK